VEAILLAGGKGERLGEAAQGRPKSLVNVAGRPLAAYQVEALAAAGVSRVIVSCAAGQEQLFEDELSGNGAEIVAVGEPEPLGRGGGIRFAARERQETGPAYALNGDELSDVDLAALGQARDRLVVEDIDARVHPVRQLRRLVAALDSVVGRDLDDAEG